MYSPADLLKHPLLWYTHSFNSVRSPHFGGQILVNIFLAWWSSLRSQKFILFVPPNHGNMPAGPFPLPDTMGSISRWIRYLSHRYSKCYRREKTASTSSPCVPTHMNFKEPLPSISCRLLTSLDGVVVTRLVLLSFVNISQGSTKHLSLDCVLITSWAWVSDLGQNCNRKRSR